jgi:hypothetical protein
MQPPAFPFRSRNEKESSNMRRKILIDLAALASALAVLAGLADASSPKHREIQRGNESKLQVVMEVSFGTVTIQRGAGDNVAVLDYDDAEENRNKLEISYEVSGSRGYLRIRSKQSSHFWGDDNDDDNGNKHHLSIKLTDALPIDFDLSLAAGRSDLDLTDLQVNELKLSTGASSVTMNCNTPNRLTTDDIVIESGVSKFTAYNLCNLNFRSLKFSGGVGSYRLDFGGSLAQSARVKVEVGLGSITINVPKHIPSKLFYDDNWLSSMHVDDDFEKMHSGEYQTEDFNSAGVRLTFDVEAGLGSVRVKRTK